MTDGVRSPTRADQAWDELAAELTPAKSLARVDTVTARAVTTITVVGAAAHRARRAQRRPAG